MQNERYEHGSRLKAYIVEVRKTAKGPQIVVSRTHPGLVKRLFELEVPEIVDGVVELKAIAREPGHRTKIAVASNDNNVDPVGACVGARGSRVRMVVNELRGEKVDIVPYSDDPSEFVMKALAPARVREVRIHPDTGTAEVIVPDFQLSLAIGKEGQNARLAARLTGWRVDIKSETQLAEEESGGGVEYAEGEWVDQRQRRARLAAGRGWRGHLGRRGRVRGAGRRGRRPTADARSRHRGAAEAAETAGRRRRAPRRAEDQRPRPRAAPTAAAAAEARGSGEPTEEQRRVSGADPSAPASGAGGRRPSAELVRSARADGGLDVGPGPGRGAWLCGPTRRTCLDRGAAPADGRPGAAHPGRG